MNLFHLSTSDDSKRKLFKPRVPKNWMTENDFENGTTARVSFSTSIDGCLRGLSSNVEGKTFYIYKALDTHKLKILPNTRVQHEVPDAHLTKEVWVLNDVLVELIGEVHVTGSYEKPIFYYFGKNKEHRGESYRWKFRETYYKKERE